MKFILLIAIPIVVAVIIGTMTHFWLWGVLSFPVVMLIVNWIAVALFGRPDNKELERITNRPVEEDFSKEELSLEASQIASRFGPKLSLGKQADHNWARQDTWSQEKRVLYETPFVIDIEMLNNVTRVVKDHYSDINNFWGSIDNHRKGELISIFTDNLLKEWPVEYSELVATRKKEIKKSYAEWGQKAFLTGYVFRKEWISGDELTNAVRGFAEFILEDVKKILVTTNSKTQQLPWH